MLPEVILRSITKPTSAFITSIVLKNYLWHIFPPTVFATDSDLPLLLGGMSPYRLRLEPQPFLLPIYESRCAPIGIWPSAPAHRWTSLELYTKLLPAQPSQLLHEFQPLQSTFGPFSVTSAILSTLNHRTDKVLSFWKRADAYVDFAWPRAYCYSAQRILDLNGLNTIHLGPPSRLELCQRCSSPKLQPFIYYVLAGAYSGPLLIVNLPSKPSGGIWWQILPHYLQTRR